MMKLLLALLIPAGLFGQAFNQIEVLPKADGSASGNLIFYNEDYTAQIKANHDATTDDLLTWKNASAVLTSQAMGSIGLGASATFGELYVYDAGWDDNITQANYRAGSSQAAQPLVRYFLNDFSTLVGWVNTGGFGVGNTYQYAFNNNVAVVDSGFQWYSANTIEVTDGSTGTGNLRLNDITVVGTCTGCGGGPPFGEHITVTTTNTYDLGTTGTRIRAVYAYDGLFLDDLTVGDDLTVSDDISVAGQISSDFIPKTSNVYDLGSASFPFAEVRAFDGIFSDDVTITDDLTVSGSVGSPLTPTADNTYDLGSGSFQWQDLHLSGGVRVDGNVPLTSNTSCPAGQAVTGWNVNGGVFISITCNTP